MTTLYIDRTGLTLDLQNNALVIREKSAIPRTIPLNLIERIVIHHNTIFNSRVLLALGNRQISLIVLGKRGDIVQTLGAPHNRAEIRLLQYQHFQANETKEYLTKETIKARLSGQIKLLEMALGDRKDLTHPLLKATRALQTSIQRIENSPESERSIAQFRGIEGGAAANFFAVYTRLFPASLRFMARKRRPPPDPVNALLSLGYTLLHSDAVKAAWGGGLDPWIGYYHDPDYGRESLASDLIESHRHHVEQMVWNLFRKQRLTKEHFGQQQGGVLLNKAGRKHFYQQWEEIAPGIRRLMRRQCYQLGHWLQEQNQ